MELYGFYNQLDIVRLIKVRRIQWAGHMLRSEEHRCIKKVWIGTPNGRRPLGRPKLRWRDRVVRDLSAIGVSTNIENIVFERTEWRGIVRAAENHPGL